MVDKMKRRFSLEQDFMNYSTDDLIYGYLQCKSTLDVNKKERYIYISDVSALKKYMAAMIQKSARTVTNKINKLIDSGLVREGLKNGKAVYILTEESEKYQLINYDILFYLLVNRSPQSIKVYTYLLNKYLWKKNYIFTISEICQALGYAESTKTGEAIVKTILDSFAREELIKWRELVFEEKVGNKVIPVVRRELIFVAERQEQLRPVIVERVRASDLKFDLEI